MNGACIVAGDTLLNFKHIYNETDPLSFDLNRFLHTWQESSESHDALIAYKLDDENETLKRGILEIDEKNRITNFLEKPKPTETKSRLASPPVYGLRVETLQQIKDFFKEKENEHRDKKDSPGTFIQWLIEKRKIDNTLLNNPLYVSLISGRFDIGNIDEYKHAVAVFGLTNIAMKTKQLPKVSIGRSYARVGFYGNPSDGYHGKTISFTIQNFRTEVIIKANQSNEVCFFESSIYDSIRSVADKGKSEGYCGGLRLLKAACSIFFSKCSVEYQNQIENRGFNIYFNTTVPKQVGLAGSSAIVCATFRALSAFYQIPLSELSEKQFWPQHILDVEVKELGIAAGLQDRVTQFYEGLVFMDFNRDFMEKNHHGIYESIDLSALFKIPHIYLAYLNEKPSDSGVVHVSLRQRFQQGEEKVLKAMIEFGEIAEKAKEILLTPSLSEFVFCFFLLF